MCYLFNIDYAELLTAEAPASKTATRVACLRRVTGGHCIRTESNKPLGKL